MTLLQVIDSTITVNNKIICSQFNFALQPGETWGVLGPNGSGKTTFLHALAGLHPLANGHILLGNEKLTQLSIRNIAKSCGILFQQPNMSFPQNVRDYCSAGRFPHLTFLKKETAHDHDVIMQALRLVELDHRIHDCITTLSGGEKKRLAIATLLTQQPAIYLLDEPANHLDVRHQVKMLNHFKMLTQTRSAAAVMALHDLNQAEQYCDHILMLYPDGKIQCGVTREMLTSANIFNLYQHPMTSLSQNNMVYWVAENK